MIFIANAVGAKKMEEICIQNWYDIVKTVCQTYLKVLNRLSNQRLITKGTDLK